MEKAEALVHFLVLQQKPTDDIPQEEPESILYPVSVSPTNKTNTKDKLKGIVLLFSKAYGE